MWYGKKSYGSIFGFAAGVTTMASGFAPGLIGLAKEALGSYTPVFHGVCVASLVVAVLMLLIRKPVRPHSLASLRVHG